MRMKSKDNLFCTFRKNDLITLKTVYDDPTSRPKKYIFKNHSTKDSSLAVVPIDDNKEEIPGFDKPIFILHIPIVSIVCAEKLPKADLLFFINELENPHIKNAIESLYEGKGSR